MKKDNKTSSIKWPVFLIILAIIFFTIAYLWTPFIKVISHSGLNAVSYFNEENYSAQSPPAQISEENKDFFIATHIDTPHAVKAVYMTSWVAGTPSIRKNLVKIIDETEINSIIIDIKDYTGKIAFTTEDPFLKKIGSEENRIADIREFIETLHKKDIYVIGRISVFQDPHLVSIRPDLAVKRESDGEVWTDYKGISWLDVGAKDVWEYIVVLGKESYKIGFDELNFDYIRFPSDGNMNDIYYPFSEERILADLDYGKAEVLKEFFAYLSDELKNTGATLSADLFGMVTTNPDDLNIGQVLEYAEPYFDYIAPMTYPSHYPRGFNGWDNPNEHVYDIVKFSMDKAVERMLLASSTPDKLRPWLQDFDYGGNYGVAEVRAQIQAVYDAGLTSWMLWSPSNIYTTDALLKE